MPTFLFTIFVVHQLFQAAIGLGEAPLPKQWLKDPEFLSLAPQECDFPIVDGSLLTNLSELPIPHIPTVIKNLTGGWTAFQKWQKEELLQAYGSRSLKSGSEASIVYSGGSAEYPITLQQLLDQMESRNRITGDNFVFDTTILYSIEELMDDFTIPSLFAEWDSYELEDEGEMWHMLSLGPSRSGLAFHNHGKTWIAVVHGAKRWFVYPVGYGAPPEINKHYNPAIAAEDWLRTVYPQLQSYPKPPLRGDSLPPFDASKGYRPLECVLQAGDVMFLPSMWTHMTINIGETIGIGGQQSLSDEERNRIASAACVYPQLQSYEVLKDLGLSIFNKAYITQENIRAKFSFIQNGVIVIRSEEEFNLLQTLTYDTIVVLHYHNDTLLAMNVSDVEFRSNIVVNNWLNISYNTLAEVEADMVLYLHQATNDGTGRQDCSNGDQLCPYPYTKMEIYPGVAHDDLQNFEGADMPNYSFSSNPMQVCTSSILECNEQQILDWFQHNEVAFGSLDRTTVKSKFEFRNALSFFRRAFLLKPMHPESISMISEISGLADQMDLMSETIQQADEAYTQHAGKVSNRTTASLFHKLGNAYFQRGYHEESMHYFQKALSYDIQFLPGWRDVSKAFLLNGQEAEAKSNLALMLQTIGNITLPDDVQQLLKDLKLVSS